MRRAAAVVGSAILALSLVTPVASVGWAAPLEVTDPVAVVADSSSGSYLIRMRAEPLVASIPAAELGGAAADAQGAVLDASHDTVLAAAGVATDNKVQDYSNAVNGFSATLDHEQAAKIAADPNVASVIPDELQQPTALRAPVGPLDAVDGIGGEKDDLYEFLGLNGQSDAWQNGITGEGVVVGVIDSGIWPEHPSFVDDGTYPPLATPLDTTTRSACDFGNTAANPNDLPFSCNNKLVGARQMLSTYRRVLGADPDEFNSSRDDDGHGTHTASTAAGDANVPATIFGRFKGLVSGIAPRAQIIAYKALGNRGGYTSDLVAAIDQAVADGVDVLNYSVGGSAATVTDTTQALLRAATAGVFTAVSAGNRGATAATIGGPADVPWVTAVGATTQTRFYDGFVELGNGARYRGASVTHGTADAAIADASRSGSAGTDQAQAALCATNTLDPAVVTGKIVLCARGGPRVPKSAEVARAGGVGMVLYNPTDTDSLFSENFYLPTVMVDNSDGLAIKSWIAATAEPLGHLTGGAFGNSPWGSPNVAEFSSRGENPTAGDIIKPDLTAPGVQILGGASPFPDAGAGPAGQLFQTIAGTSMSSPIVAGMYALLKQVHPDWSAAAAKSALMTTANSSVLDSDRLSPATPLATGSGMARTGGPALRGSAFNPGLIYDAGLGQYQGFLCDEGRDGVPDSEATCAAFAAAGVPTHATDLNYPSIGDEAVSGSATVVRSVMGVTDSTISYRAAVVEPAGYAITVTPSELTIAPGQTVWFSVTITNLGTSTPGEWRFGSLTWSGGGTSVGSSGYAYGGFNVRSPIAVKAP